MSDLADYRIGEDASGDVWIWQGVGNYVRPILSRRAVDDAALWEVIVALVNGSGDEMCRRAKWCRRALADQGATPMTCDHEAQIRDLLEEREELLTEIRRLRMGNHPAGRALQVHINPFVVDDALAEALTERDAEHEETP